MAITHLGGNPVNTNGQLPSLGVSAPNFELVANDLTRVTLENYQGIRLILNIFPSIDTATCATSVRRFNQIASELKNTKVLCISKDLPFAQKRFCGAEGIENVETLSDFVLGKFSKNYGVELVDGKLIDLSARAIVVLNAQHEVIYVELVNEIADEPNYDSALKSLNN
jgi:thioredoxin-dependent peroxiredoxin